MTLILILIYFLGCAVIGFVGGMIGGLINNKTLGYISGWTIFALWALLLIPRI